MKKTFFYSSPFDFKNFYLHLPNKKNIILDYGCGNGIFSKKDLTNNKIKFIYMFDQNKEIKKYIESKYKKSKKIKWSDNTNLNYNIVLINSVSQYLSKYDYLKLINFFQKKKVDLIVVSDVPKYNRIIETCILFFTYPKDLLHGLGYLLNRKYLSLNYYFKKKKDLIIKNNKYDYVFRENLSSNKITRYTILIKKI